MSWQDDLPPGYKERYKCHRCGKIPKNDLHSIIFTDKRGFNYCSEECKTDPYEPMIDDRVRVVRHVRLTGKIGTVIAFTASRGYRKVQIDGQYSWVAIHKKNLEEVEE